MDKFNVLIVGAGHGGAQAAVLLRQKGFAGTIGIVGDEPWMPYERPPLSKEYLLGEKPLERLYLRPTDFWAARSVTMLLGQRVERVDPAAKLVVTAQGNFYGYDKLIWAAGGRPRTLLCEGHDLAGIHVVRTLDDANAIGSALPGVAHVVVIGGGYIGLEAAAVLRKFDKQVTLIEALPRVLARVAAEPLSRFYELEHRAQGVDIRLNAQFAGFEGEDGRVSGVRMAADEVVPAQLVVVGIGITPNAEPLIAAGAVGTNGVDVDAWCRTSLPDIFAIGDCSAHESPWCEGKRIRIESVQNANDQAAVAVMTILDKGEPYKAVPWFWSNQYNLRLQTIGLSAGYDSLVVRGDPAARSFSIVYARDNRVIALDCVNATRDYAQGRALVVNGATIDPAKLADHQTPLKDLAA